MRPEDFVTARGVPVKRLRSVRSLTSGEVLPFEIHTSIVDSIKHDPLGEVVISTNERALDRYVSTFALEFAPALR
jgi:hypothetical protein